MKRNLTVIVDLSVILHQMHSGLVSAGIADKERYEGAVQAQLAWVMSLKWLGTLLPRDTSRAQVVLACDQKDSDLRYWRHGYLKRMDVVSRIPGKDKGRERKRQELLKLIEAYPYSGDRSPEVQETMDKLTEDLAVAYKAGRKFPDPTFTALKRAVMDTAISRQWRLLRFTGYEADDVAAAIVAVNAALPDSLQNNILLVTVDNDWLGMVSDRVAWFESQGRFPRLRDSVASVSYWAEKREGYSVDTPRQIWDMKVKHGDPSDALPPGCPIEVLDLFKCPKEYRLWESPAIAGLIEDWLQNPDGIPVDEATADRASQWLIASGIPRCIRPFEPEAMQELYGKISKVPQAVC